jgi:hypothetical protein
MERGRASPHLALVLDVVVDEESIMQKLDRDGGAHGVRRGAPNARAVAMQMLGRIIFPPRRG